MTTTAMSTPTSVHPLTVGPLAIAGLDHTRQAMRMLPSCFRQLRLVDISQICGWKVPGERARFLGRTFVAGLVKLKYAYAIPATEVRKPTEYEKVCPLCGASGEVKHKHLYRLTPTQANRELLIATSSAGRNPVSASVSASAINRMPMIGQLILHDMRTELLAQLRQFSNGTIARDLEGQSGLFVPQPGGDNENYLFWLLIEQLIGSSLVEKRYLTEEEKATSAPDAKRSFWLRAI